LKNKVIKSLIVDDEPIARDVIKKFLVGEKHFKIAGECGNGVDAVLMILDKKPDVVFLDIQMPEMDGFEVIKAIGLKNLPHIIFVTAYDRYAIKAFEINALDYLLKPFDKERFQTAINRAKDLIFSKNNIKQQLHNLVGNSKDEQAYLKRILIKASGRVFFVKTDEISWIEAAAYYVKLHVRKEVHLIRETLNNLENKLDPAFFVRIHKSHIVNLEFIKEIQPWTKNKYVVILNDKTKLNLSRNYREKFFNLFKIS